MTWITSKILKIILNDMHYLPSTQSIVAEVVFFTEIYTKGKKVELIIQNLHLLQKSNENKCRLAC